MPGQPLEWYPETGDYTIFRQPPIGCKLRTQYLGAAGGGALVRSLHRFGILVSLGYLGAVVVLAQEQPPSGAVVPFEVSLAAPAKPSTPAMIPLTVQQGVPLDVILEKQLKITKQTGVPVRGRVVEPIYVFDHLVVPSGSELLGHVNQVDTLSRKQRALHIANGDFTHFRQVHVDFDTLVLKDGRHIPVHTAVTQGALETVHLSAGDEGKKKKGRAGQAVNQARQEVKSREQQAIQDVKAPGKSQRVKTWLEGELPYHPQSLPAGTHFTAELKQPLDLGVEALPQQPPQAGAQIPAGSNVHVRLLTVLSSATDHRGSPVQAVVSEPVYSSDHKLILPEGTRLEGTVTQAVPARRMGRNGQLRFVFRQIDLAQGASQRVEASLQSVDAPSSAHMKVDSEGGAHAVTPKSKYIAPAIDVVLAAGSLDGLDPHNHERIQQGLGPQGPDVAGGAVRGGAGFGLVGSVVGLLAHYRPVSAGFAFYGAGISVYTHVVARGNDVVFAKNTPMEIRFGTHGGPPAPSAASSHISP